MTFICLFGSSSSNQPPQTPEIKLRSGGADNVDADVTQKNWIHDNTFRTYGNECVDCKEGSTLNLIENNVCEQQFDENSGCFGSRGSGNTFRYNKITGCLGAGVRVGGDKGYGEDNNIYDNEIADCDYGAFNVMAAPQGKVCGNKISLVDTVVSIFSLCCFSRLSSGKQANAIGPHSFCGRYEVEV